jgi:OMF family outer membrane factor
LAELQLQQDTEQLRLDVSLDYYNAQQADAQVSIAQSAVNNAQISLRDAQAQERAGTGTKADVLQAQVNLANALQNFNKASTSQRISRRQLAQRLSLANTVDVIPAEPVAIAGDWRFSLADSIILALKNRVELQQELSRREIAVQGRRIALSALRPQVSFFANVNTLDETFDSFLPRMGYSVGVQLNMSLFDGGSARAEADQQVLNINQAEINFASSKEQIRLAVEQAFFSLQANQQNLESSRTSVEQAAESLRLARLRFQAGVGQQADVTQAEADLTRAQGNFLSATLDYNRQLANLKRAVGYADTKQ